MTERFGDGWFALERDNLDNHTFVWAPSGVYYLAPIRPSANYTISGFSSRDDVHEDRANTGWEYDVVSAEELRAVRDMVLARMAVGG